MEEHLSPAVSVSTEVFTLQQQLDKIQDLMVATEQLSSTELVNVIWI